MIAEREGASVVLVGATGFLGAALRRELVARQFPLRKITMMSAGEEDEVGQIVEYDGEARVVNAFDGEQLARTDLLFLGRRGTAARQALVDFRRGNGVAIDLVDVATAPGDAVVNMDVNRDSLPTTRPAHISSPHGVSQALSTAVASVAAGARVVSLAATVLTPASDSGKRGVDELYQQTSSVLTFGEQPRAVFERQVAFNAVPHALLHRQQGWPDLDRRLDLEIAAILDVPHGVVSIRAVLVPVFHAVSLLVTVELDPMPSRATRKKRWGRAPLNMQPCTAAELEESEAVQITDLTEEGSDRVEFWAVADNLRYGGASNGVRIAEAVLEESGREVA